MDCSPSGSSVPGILQARILEWVAMPFSRGSSQPRDRTHISQVSCIGRQILYHWAIMEAHIHIYVYIYVHNCMVLWHFDFCLTGSLINSWQSHQNMLILRALFPFWKLYFNIAFSEFCKVDLPEVTQGTLSGVGVMLPPTKPGISPCIGCHCHYLFPAALRLGTPARSSWDTLWRRWPRRRFVWSVV